MALIRLTLKSTDTGDLCKYGHVRQAKGGTGASPGTHPTLETNKQVNNGFRVLSMIVGNILAKNSNSQKHFR